MQELTERQAALRRVVREGGIHTQRQLVERLGSLGFSSTQAAVSRDVAQMGVTKLEEGLYALEEDLALKVLLEGKARRVAHAGCLGVISCERGDAGRLARSLDACGFDEILGTIAGVDTVLIVCSSEEAAAAFETLADRLPWPYA